ncbi:MAG: DUF6636 domain-containing protein [Pseudomonadota bacterium]
MRLICYSVFAALFVGLPAQASGLDRPFASPTGNITCTINAFVATCTIAEYDPSFTNVPDSCNGDWGGTFYVVGRGEAKLGCLTSSVEPPNFVLGYGQSIDVGDLSCVSRPTGVTCTNAAGRGFSVRRAEQRIF